MERRFRGTGVALITPFTKEKQIDYVALDNLVGKVIDDGVDFLVVFGTTAETPTLNSKEQQEVLAKILKKNSGKLPIVLGVGGNNTSAIENTLKNMDYSGIDAILSVTPYYNKPNQKGLYEHFKVIASASDRPVILYNVPGRTGINMSAETCLRLAEDKNIVGIKEAGGNIAQISSIIKYRPNNFTVLSGDDGLSVAQIALGADGVISVAANAFPKDFSSMVRCALNGDFLTARKLHLQYSDLFELLFVEGNPTGVKGVMYLQKMIENELRLPLCSASDTLLEKLKNGLSNHN